MGSHIVFVHVFLHATKAGSNVVNTAQTTNYEQTPESCAAAYRFYIHMQNLFKEIT